MRKDRRTDKHDEANNRFSQSFIRPLKRFQKFAWCSLKITKFQDPTERKTVMIPLQDAVSGTDYIASSGRVVVLKWTRGVEESRKYLICSTFPPFAFIHWREPNKYSFRIIGILAQILSGHLEKTSPLEPTCSVTAMTVLTYLSCQKLRLYNSNGFVSNELYIKDEQKHRRSELYCTIFIT